MPKVERLEQRLDAARALLVPQVYPSDTERALRRFKDLGARRRRRTAVAGVFATAATAATAAFFYLKSAVPPSEPARPEPSLVIAPPAAPEKKIVHFADGSQAELLKEKTELRVDISSPELLALTVVSGAAKIDVVPNPNRLFRVSTEHLRIEVLGTAFTVYQEAGDESVTVHRGRVAVYSKKDRYELVQGMTYRYDEALDGEVAAVKPRASSKKARGGKGRIAAAKDGARRAKWKQLAEDGQIKEAYEAMEPPRSNDVQELMLAADVARLTGHPAEAAEFLQTAVDRHRGDPNAVLAAFTLARIYERELRAPKKAAEFYRTARELLPDGSLAEDALVHEIECRNQAGEVAKAKALAKEYVSRYPSGRKIEQLRRIAGIEG